MKAARARPSERAKPSTTDAETGDPGRRVVHLSATQRPGKWCVVTGAEVPPEIYVAATISESEGLTTVISVGDAQRLGIDPAFIAAWLTVDAQTSLTAIGLTAALASALARVGIACNVLAGYHHDHLLVPYERARQAIGIIDSLDASSLS